ncbi:MAG: class I SAM-dependent methyltransferase [Elusimicrobiales bacterium]|nr:class I SAM-dependent methyltransferase [Elusimicrobiales bacterium]
MDNFVLNYFEINKDNWWYISRNELIYSIIKIYCEIENPKILDVGCGCGVLIEYLKVKGYNNVFGIDAELKFVELAMKKGFDVKLINIEDGINVGIKYDVIILSDVLEHINNDIEVIKSIFSALSENGLVIIFVPAFMCLWSWHDTVNKHRRRYVLREIENKIKSTGFNVIFSSYWNLTLFIPALIIRNLKRLFKMKTHDFYKIPYFINNLIILFLKLENYLIKNKVKIPFGVSVFCIVKKK